MLFKFLETTRSDTKFIWDKDLKRSKKATFSFQNRNNFLSQKSISIALNDSWPKKYVEYCNQSMGLIIHVSVIQRQRREKRMTSTETLYHTD